MFELGVGPVFTNGWKAFTEHIGKAVLFALIYGVGILILMIPFALIFGAAFMSALMAGGAGGEQAANLQAALAGGSMVVFFIVYIIVMIVLLGWVAGFIHSLKLLILGDDPDFGQMFSQFRKIGNLILLGIIMGICIGIGFFLLIIPGLFLLIMWSQAYLLVVDKDMDAMSALSASWKRVAGDFWSVLGILLLLMIVGGVVSGVLGMIPFIGSLVTLLLVMPWLVFCQWSLYYALFPPAREAATEAAGAGVPPPPPPPPPDQPKPDDEMMLK